MKKIFLFLALFFLFSVLSAEEACEGNRQCPEAGKSVKNCACNQYKAIKEPKKIYFAPVLGWRFAITAALDMDLDFLVKHTERKNNIYLGLSTGLAFNRWGDYGFDNVFEMPLHANIVFDFKQKNCVVDYLSLRLFGGADLFFERKELFNPHRYEYDGLSKVDWRVGISLDVVFSVNIVFRTGLTTEYSYPVPFLGLGYRF